ncbi:MAG: hypothetical protein AB8G16_18820 [Gammaproteobacteria bacterium]
MQQLIRKAPRVRNGSDFALLALVFAGLIAAPIAVANPNGAITIDGSSLQNNNGWSPDIPASDWHPFSLTLPPGVQYVDSTDSVSGTLTVDVVDPTTLGISYPKNRLPFAVFVIDGSGDELDTPMTLTWPNVHDYPVGEAHLVYVYDEALSSWDVAGAATVSSDGLTLEQPNTTFNIAVSYYFVDQNVLLTWP